MKHLAICILAVSLTGCVTPGQLSPTDHARQAKKVAAYVETTAKAAVDNTVDKYPDLRPYYKASVALIDLLLQNKDYSPEGLVKAMQELKINEIKNERFAKNMVSVLKLYQVEANDRINAKLDQNLYVRPILQGLRDGIAAGLE